MSCETGIKVIVPRSGYMCTSVGIHVYLGRGTCEPRSGYDDLKAFFNGKTVISPPHHMLHIVFSKNIFALFS